MPALLVEESPRASAGYLAGRRRRTDAYGWFCCAGSASWLFSSASLPGCCPRWDKGACWPLVHFAKQHCLYFFTAAAWAGIVASDFRFISYWLRGLHRLRIRYPVLVKRQRRRRDTLDAGDKFIRRQIIQRAKLFFAAVERDSVQLRLSSAGNVDQSLSATPRR